MVEVGGLFVGVVVMISMIGKVLKNVVWVMCVCDFFEVIVYFNGF